jgi:hypothetical protein
VKRLAIFAAFSIVATVLVVLWSDRSGERLGVEPEIGTLPWNTPEVKAEDVPPAWPEDFPKGDFTILTVLPSDIVMALDRDEVVAIDGPRLAPVTGSDSRVADVEAVVSVEIGGEVRAYPIRILMWHEIVNDVVGGVPVAVTFCPLCNSVIVFDRRVGDRVLDFGNTGRVRYSNLIMYDRQTESWWQQFTGEAIVGTLAGARLEALPARVESLALYRGRHPRGLVLVPTDRHARAYGRNPYEYYDRRDRPYGLHKGPLMPTDIAPMARVVVVDGEGWSLSLLRAEGRIETADLVLTWEPGQASSLDSAFVSQGRDVGNVTVQRKIQYGLEDAVYDLSFGFAFRAFHPQGILHASPNQHELGVD